MTILASFVKWVITYKTLKSCPEHGEISINYYDYYSLLSFTSRGSNMFSKVLRLWRWIDLGSKACLCLCLAAQLLARCLILNAQISHQYSRDAVICSIFLNCIKWCHLGSWPMIDSPCMVAVATSSPSKYLQPFNSAWGQRGEWSLARYEDKRSSGIGEQVCWVSNPERRHQVWGCSGRCLVPLWWMFPQSRREQYRKFGVYHQEGKTHCDFSAMGVVIQIPPCLFIE